MAYNFDSKTLAQLQTEGSSKWSKYPGTICMWLAEMDFGIAPELRDYLIGEAQRGTLGYLPAAETPQILDSAASWMANFGPRPDTSRMILIPEVLEGLRIAIRDFTTPGTDVVVPTPAYMPFLTIPAEFGREVVQVPSHFDPQARRWAFDFEALEEALPEGGLLILCNPWNPTGRCLDRSELTRISQIVEAKGARVFEDAIHAPILIDGEYIPYGSLNEATRRHTITAIAASKGWNIPGLKAAQLIFHNDADWQAFAPKAGAASSPTSTIGARAARIAFTHCEQWRTEMCQYVAQNLALLEARVETWPGAHMAHVEGTYIAFLDFTDAGLGSDPIEVLRTQAGVSLTAGGACGAGYETYGRMIVATPRAVLEAALNAIEKVLPRG
ncbi:hypothetical protein ACU19_03590 [Actinobaculum suis]|uniref:MalY/PatB family protein n=1 Tax=Actinobaculum suis TaxID=1657 RepID=UPI00066FBDCF|nr:aminotransferase class I/II-fold pyridoxal phosphate-dependent enzyme [Actinobaculum suis]KMY23521.1 hypothetical protein ACU19_03590 [Actinobaculum suis]